MPKKWKASSRREIGLGKIKFAGYHGKDYHFIAIDFRISYEVAREWHAKGVQAKASGVGCNCMDCKEAKAQTP